MRLARFSVNGYTRIGRVLGQSITSLSDRLPGVDDDMTRLIASWPLLGTPIAALADTADYALGDVTIEAPVARPGKIMAIGFNYRDHAAEANVDIPKYPEWFTKAITSVAGPYQKVLRPAVSKVLDYEAELVYIIGKRCKHVPLDRAQDVIFGYCAGNDISVRDWQVRTKQVTIGKSFDTSAPFGPYIVTPDELDAANLGIRSFVNGVKRQDSNTRHLIFDCPAQIAYLSQAMTLEPGDVIFTGTPGGVGALMDPKVWLRPGDKVRVEIDGIGAIENEIEQEVASAYPD
jgi:2-keto-4-pentenoate hydratase/2-oxohepta-3-ene-1,7-dioic acid hydratase in catechol pathway